MKAFEHDLQKIYDYVSEQNSRYQAWFDLLQDSSHPAKEQIEPMLEKLGLPNNAQNTMALLTRIINLREDSLDQVLKKSGFDKDEMIEKKEIMYNEVAAIHLQKHEDLIAWIEKNGLLTPFYRQLIRGVHRVGKAMSSWQSSWTAAIINGVNEELLQDFNGDEAAIMHYLRENDLFDCCENGPSERCYSILQKKQGGYERVAYARAFAKQVQNVVTALKQMIESLKAYEDNVYDQKKQWLAYLEAIKDAFACSDPNRAIDKWTVVDEKWMEVTTPLQVGHPLEYYEDHFRKAVALEWDLRILNPKLQNDLHLQNQIKTTMQSLHDNATCKRNIAQVDKTKLYIGQPVLYYAAEFNGLFSAQVVPNDESVSDKAGKKIFAFADFVRQMQLAKPTLKITREIFGKAYIAKKKAFMKEAPKLWHKVYAITTIGHEYGHIFWLQNDTESKMNQSGQFKNIEEFKATCGGLVTFFDHEEHDLKEHIVDDTVSRAVGLMAWREVAEVRPYYVEGLLHLNILFTCGVITFEQGMIRIDYSRYEAMKEAYRSVYTDLSQHYLDKKDAALFLQRYMELENGGFAQKDQHVQSFVDHFWRLYQDHGQDTV
ncbi:MAG: invasion protein CiaB [Campylobacterota bacterium]